MPLPKELRTTKRYGSRYGRTTKHRAAVVEREQRTAHKCPYCNKEKVYRLVMGIWKCEKCLAVFTGKAYSIHAKRLTVEELAKTRAETALEVEAQDIREKEIEEAAEEEEKAVAQ